VNAILDEIVSTSPYATSSILQFNKSFNLPISYIINVVLGIESFSIYDIVSISFVLFGTGNVPFLDIINKLREGTYLHIDPY